MRIIMILSILALAACDQATNAPANQPPVTSIRSHSWSYCATGKPRFEQRGPNLEREPFSWNIDIIISNGDTIHLPTDTVKCREIGAFPDTTRFKFMAVGLSNWSDSKEWILMDGRDSMPRKWSSTFHPDSIRAVRWED